MTKKQAFDKLREELLNYDAEALKKAAEEVTNQGLDPLEAMDVLSTTIRQVGEKYGREEIFLPELIMTARALQAGTAVLMQTMQHIKIEGQAKRQIVLGVVEGDIHTIGKDLVKVMLEAAGWTVHDLGSDVKLERFVEEQRKTNSDIVGLSALMTMTMRAMPKAIKLIKAYDPNVAIMVGGAPLTRDIAKTYGADGYADNAAEAVQEATKLISGSRQNN